ncbi:DUF2218 domain-containing protein [Pseudomonas cavernae]|uniref:DUF2218 domain-containing protein n=1 Tax=Pseudomonas cavernae TaxID=2320867 RepID=A0A385Z374_9PSED|nr:DUF2218 domain-containing protein [Pseudomonas cavernae]AYC32343.1 DUF2218 domain-containing protein [Pseudomonas cavernae]
MTVYDAYVNCANPARLMTRLCRHWGHKFTVELDEGRGAVEFPNGRCEFVSEVGLLQVSLRMPEDNQARMQQVVAEHLQRMAGDEPLVIEWRVRLE